MFRPLFSRAARIRRQTENRLAEYQTQKKDFFILIFLASAIATVGLALNNVNIIIGAMVVAPLITPVFGFSLSLIVLNGKSIFRSLLMLMLGTVGAIVVAALIGYAITLLEGTEIARNEEILSRTQPNMLFFLTAIFSGMAGAYTYSRPLLVASIAGIAISVAVIPPLAVAGLGIALQDSAMISSSLLLYVLNLAGICFGSIIMFVSMGFGKEE